mmetsp:Transcript_7266/g.10146  ORF Transcript_7266/g.10146 Transcript_7266/m.10146 type:complete len:353 (+) Transcript_7266:25-1083(+)|eukprot:CAMPEP_0184480352 /NCGR_PEP_ID=MMETSP0113_2-20130426/1837_1 /TAXON_ID=91329 /ORGANISM="Norrisiella sphaerica, Strain BC52" /LENGTH=352 /DNA_ID=CAMNT_0026858761 /DNA_START=58 /DNA_END=1116 /DNA_ORIENTATION=-
MPVLSVTNWTLLAILIPALALFYILLTFVKQYRSAWLKMIVILSYIAAILLTAVQIIVVSLYPPAATQILILFNCAGQLIAATGILESIQFLHAVMYLKRQKKTNMMYIKIWLVAAVIGLIPYALAVPGIIPIYIYRCMSAVVIGVETLLYVIVLMKIWKAKNVTAALIYYGTTILCRVGILTGIILRLQGASVLVVNVIHYTSVIVTAVSMLMFTKLFHKTVKTVHGGLESVKRRASQFVSKKNSNNNSLVMRKDSKADSKMAHSSVVAANMRPNVSSSGTRLIQSFKGKIKQQRANSQAVSIIPSDDKALSVCDEKKSEAMVTMGSDVRSPASVALVNTTGDGGIPLRSP